MKVRDFLKKGFGLRKLDDEPEKLSEITNWIKNLSKWIQSNEQNRIKLFEVGEKFGIHLTPVHFYQPIPETKEIPLDLFDKPLPVGGVDLREKEQLELLQKLSKYSK